VPRWLAEVDVLLLAVPDDAVTSVARQIAAVGAIGKRHTVLHVSGVLGEEALAPLADSGAALGSLHPYQTLAPPVEKAVERMAGAVAGVSGSDDAVGVASDLARSAGLTPVRVAAEQKPLYHAAAVFASNYLVALEGVAERLLVEAGMSTADARRALGPLMAAALDNVRSVGPKAALTGPVARGDAETIRRHLATLPPEAATLYRELARAALELADLIPEQRAAVEGALE
jgi:predicted short-subunit dehydrogenase-like oxidoreductase (DUF2520 family)